MKKNDDIICSKGGDQLEGIKFLPLFIFGLNYFFNIIYFPNT